MVHIDDRRKGCGVFPRGSNDEVVFGMGISESNAASLERRINFSSKLGDSSFCDNFGGSKKCNYHE